MTPRSLRLRLLIGAGVFILTAVIVSAVGLALLFERHVQRWVDGQLNAHMQQLIAGLDLGSQQQIVVRRPPSDPRFEQPLSGLYWEAVVEPAGPVLRSRSLWDFEIALPQETAVSDDLQHYRVAGPGGSSLYMLQRRIVLPQRLGAPTARVAVALDAGEVRASVWRFTTALVPFLLVIGGLLTLAAWAQVAIGLRPLTAVRDKLSAIRSGSIRRLEAGFPVEVQPLAHEIDALLDQRDRQVERARGRAADLAHGLKTPLQVLAGEAERLAMAGAGESAGVIRDASAAMQRHVDREMTRARLVASDANASSNVRHVAESVVGVVRRTPNGSRLNWTVEVPRELSARIDQADLAEALGNLIENAARHAKSAVCVAGSTSSGMVSISILDDGGGIPRDQLEEALRRGGRLDTSGQGAGLGLAIVSEIASSWRGTLLFPDALDGDQRFRVCLQLPVAATRPNEGQV